MIIILCLALGIALRLASGRDTRSLSAVKMRGENFLLGLLVTQAVMPVLHLTGAAATVAYYAWLATFPCMVFIALLNRRAPGMALLGAGLMLNFIVISANGGMPVFPEAAAMAKPAAAALTIPAGDFVHVLGTATTHLPWLADVLPLPGPLSLQLVPSPGDLLLYSGIVAFLAGAPMRLTASEGRK